MFLLKNKALLVISVLLGLAFLAAGSAKLAGTEQMRANFAHFGYVTALMYFVGLCEVAGAIGLFIEKTAKYAALGLSIIMLGAAGSHFLNDPIQRAGPACLLLLLCATATYMHFKSEKAAPEPPAAEA